MPPLVGVAVNITFWPAQMEVEEAALPTLGVNVELTVIETVFEFAVVGLAQLAFEVMVQ